MIYLRYRPKYPVTILPINAGTVTPSAGSWESTITIPTPIVATYRVRAYAAKAGTLTDVKAAVTGAGSVSCSLAVNGTPVSGFPTTLDTSPQSVSVNQSYNAGAHFDFSITAVTGATMVSLGLLGTNN